MPRSMMSAASSGGVFSKVSLMASTTIITLSAKASRTSSAWMVTFLGRPSTRLRPLISTKALMVSSVGKAEPMRILISSAVRSPMSRLYFFFT